MTRLLYYEDAYQRSFEAVVMAVLSAGLVRGLSSMPS